MTCSRYFLSYLQSFLTGTRNSKSVNIRVTWIESLCPGIVYAWSIYIKDTYAGNTSSTGDIYARNTSTEGTFAKESYVRNCFFRRSTCNKSASIKGTSTTGVDIDAIGIESVSTKSTFAGDAFFT